MSMPFLRPEYQIKSNQNLLSKNVKTYYVNKGIRATRQLTRVQGEHFALTETDAKRSKRSNNEIVTENKLPKKFTERTHR